MLILAFFLALPIGTLALGIVSYIVTIPIAFILIKASVTTRSIIAAFISFGLGAAAGVFVVRYLFISLAGSFPIWASFHWLAGPLINDRKRYLERKALLSIHNSNDESPAKVTLDDHYSGMLKGTVSGVAGMLIGCASAIGYIFLR